MLFLCEYCQSLDALLCASALNSEHARLETSAVEPGCEGLDMGRKRLLQASCPRARKSLLCLLPVI